MKKNISNQRIIRHIEINDLEKINSLDIAVSEAPFYSKDNYQFKQFVFGEESPAIPHELLSEFKLWALQKCSQFPKPKAILSAEPNGIVWGALVAEALGVPLLVCRLSDTQGISMENQYSTKNFYLGATGRGEPIVIVDDIVSSGITIRVLTEIAQKNSFSTMYALVVYDKKRLTNSSNIPIFALNDH